MRKNSKRLLAVAAIVICLIALIVAQSSRGILNRPTPPADQKISYGKDQHEFGELRLPKGPGPHPVAIVIHGGCWMAEYGLSYMGHLAAALAEAGVATWSIEYRRVGNDGGGWPGTFEDAALATDYLRTLATTYPIDLNRVVAIGHSAGGHLALWLAARSKLPKDNSLYSATPLKLRGVISLAGIPDLRQTGSACDANVKQLMGGPASDQTARYDLASPAALLPLGIKQIVIHGEIDNLVPSSMSRDYAPAAQKKGDDVKLVMIDQAGHFELVDPKSAAWPIVKNETMKLINK